MAGKTSFMGVDISFFFFFYTNTFCGYVLEIAMFKGLLYDENGQTFRKKISQVKQIGKHFYCGAVLLTHTHTILAWFVHKTPKTHCLVISGHLWSFSRNHHVLRSWKWRKWPNTEKKNTESGKKPVQLIGSTRNWHGMAGKTSSMCVDFGYFFQLFTKKNNLRNTFFPERCQFWELCKKPKKK